jgi:hypothetical protein
VLISGKTHASFHSKNGQLPRHSYFQADLEATWPVDVADLQVNGDVIEIRSLKRKPREGWAQDGQRLAAAGDDALVWPESGNEGDAELVW